MFNVHSPIIIAINLNDRNHSMIKQKNFNTVATVQGRIIIYLTTCFYS